MAHGGRTLALVIGLAVVAAAAHSLTPSAARSMARSPTLGAARASLLRPSRLVACARKPVWSFVQAREYARSFGFASAAEYKEYRCPGAYALPREPEVVYAAEWAGWDDFIGLMRGEGEVERKMNGRVARETDRDTMAG